MNWDIVSDSIDNLVGELDDTAFPVPNIDVEPHLLISKVRKHYMEYVVKLLSTNLKVHQNFTKNSECLPSATTIWRFAKNMELKAAQTSMVVQLYRKYFVKLISEVKNDTKKGKIYRELYKYHNSDYQSEKETQTSISRDCNCQCYCNNMKRRRKLSITPRQESLSTRIELLTKNINSDDCTKKRIPVITNMQSQSPMAVPSPMPDLINANQVQVEIKNCQIPTEQHPDEVMLQMEKMFQSDQTDDDLFESTLYETTLPLESKSNIVAVVEENTVDSIQNSIIQTHAAQIKILDERLATLTGLMKSNEPQNVPQQLDKVIPRKGKHVSKWHCEEYYLKKNLYELLYQIGDNNRKKLFRIKEMFVVLFGPDSDDEEEVMSPDESQEMVDSCKARIDAWVMSILAPYYARGRIKGKGLYKAVAKHLIGLIYKCKPYPSHFEVTSFVTDFLENHSNIRCEADFKQFRIENVHQAPHHLTFV